MHQNIVILPFTVLVRDSELRSRFSANHLLVHSTIKEIKNQSEASLLFGACCRSALRSGTNMILVSVLVSLLLTSGTLGIDTECVEAGECLLDIIIAEDKVARYSWLFFPHSCS